MKIGLIKNPAAEGCYYVATCSEPPTFIGRVEELEDGTYCFWSTDGGGCYTQQILEGIAKLIRQLEEQHNDSRDRQHNS